MTDFNEKLAKLQSKLLVQRLFILHDPFPVINTLADRCNRMMEAIEEIDRALSPLPVYEFADKHSIMPHDIQGEALIRTNAALKVIRDYRREIYK